MTLPKRAHYFNPRRHTYAYEQDFVPGCLYLMLMVPDSVFYGERTHEYPAVPAEDVRYTTYDAVAANSKGEALEEFDWELYWHQGPEGGKIYRIEKNDNAPPNYGYERIDVEDIRNIPQCVGFIRLFSTREFAIADVESCVDWTTRSAAQGCRRSKFTRPTPPPDQFLHLMNCLTRRITDFSEPQHSPGPPCASTASAASSILRKASWPSTSTLSTCRSLSWRSSPSRMAISRLP